MLCVLNVVTMMVIGVDIGMHALLPKWGAIYKFQSLWDLKSEIISLHFIDLTLVKVISP